MEIQNIEGNWMGVIYLGKRYRKYEGKEIYFDLEMKQDGNKINGIAIDTGGFGINPDPATIQGSINDKNIDFVKQYKSHHYMNGSGEMKNNKSRSGPPIFYTGKYNDLDKTVSGGWIIKTKYKLFKIFPITIKAEGTWTMKRK